MEVRREGRKDERAERGREVRKEGRKKEKVMEGGKEGGSRQ